MAEPPGPGAGPPVRKRSLNRAARLLRLIGGVLDPRAWAHAFKLINYYNYTHVQPRRLMQVGARPSISPNAAFSNAERIVIGADARIGARCTLWAGPSRGRIVIGDDILLGPEVLITAAGYRFNDGAPVSDQPMDEADVVIGDDVWIGARVIVLPGSSIGDGAVIGAGAVVRGAIPPGAVAVGAPARTVAMRRIQAS